MPERGLMRAVYDSPSTEPFPELDRDLIRGWENRDLKLGSGRSDWQIPLHYDRLGQGRRPCVSRDKRHWDRLHRWKFDHVYHRDHCSNHPETFYFIYSVKICVKWEKD